MAKKLFKSLTIQMKLKLWLESLGYVEAETRTSKYIAMKHPGKERLTYFLGKSGAFRISEKGITDSYSMAPNKEKFGKFCEGQEAQDDRS